jgi:hypothetical protein
MPGNLLFAAMLSPTSGSPSFIGERHGGMADSMQAMSHLDHSVARKYYVCF